LEEFSNDLRFNEEDTSEKSQKPKMGNRECILIGIEKVSKQTHNASTSTP
jgi:hypothetical protein